MIDDRDIENGLKAVLNTAALGYAINWPNQAQSGDKPRLEVQFAGGEAEGGTLAGNEVERTRGIMSITVVDEVGIGSGGAGDIADEIKALYPEGLRIAVTGGQVVIMKPPSIQKGFKDGPKQGELTEWRVPVIIDYKSETA